MDCWPEGKSSMKRRRDVQYPYIKHSANELLALARETTDPGKVLAILHEFEFRRTWLARQVKPLVFDRYLELTAVSGRRPSNVTGARQLRTPPSAKPRKAESTSCPHDKR